jgi:hypothetical protein
MQTGGKMSARSLHGRWLVFGPIVFMAFLSPVVLFAALPCQAEQPTKLRPSAPRTDAVSKLAHQELLDKAKQGHIDIYFVGDSMPRHWGTSDPQYNELLANWKQSFFG